jgi:L-methionine (R)-S-oxide reductase
MDSKIMESKEDKRETQYNNVIENLKTMYEKYDTELKLNQIAKMASISSAIKSEFSEFTFVGFYIVVSKAENGTNTSTKYLEIGPYVSNILATPRIELGKGVCGSTWEEKQTKIVNNVRNCNNYIACSLDVLSEIVVPVFSQNDESEVVAVLDIDCKVKDRFKDIDKNYLEFIIKNFS